MVWTQVTGYVGRSNVCIGNVRGGTVVNVCVHRFTHVHAVDVTKVRM